MRAVRGNPFGEWIVVFYDSEKATPAVLLAKVQKAGCPDAKRMDPVSEKKSDVTATVENPVAVSGDFLHVTIAGAKEAPDVVVPEGWTVETRTATRVNVQTPKSAKVGKHSITIKAGGGELKLAFELVMRVRE